MSDHDMPVNGVRTVRNPELLARIEAFELDHPGSSLPFSQRLARDNGWERAYAHRVLREYRRFAYLGMEAGHPVAPSEAVDQAWHLHLIYTDSYWRQFCGEALGRPFHHGPTRGGASEGAKHLDWYARTLSSYREHFGEAPPADIWPAPEERFRDAACFRRVNTRASWIIAKPAVWQRLERWARERRTDATVRVALGRLGWAACILLLLAGCIDDLDVFNYRGPEFLKFFLVFTLLCFSAAGLWRWTNRLPARAASPEDIPSDPYEIAYLSGGPRRVLESALATLLHRKTVRVEASGKIRSKSYPPKMAALHPVESQLLTNLSRKEAESFAAVQKRLTDIPESIGATLADKGLTLSESARRRLRNQCLMWAALAPTVGVVKIVVGLLRDRPVAFLVVLTIISALLALALFARRPVRTRLGDRVIRQLRAQHSNLRRERSLDEVSPAHSGVLATAVGLYGMGMLANTGLAADYNRLQSGYQSSSGNGGSSGCSSDSGGGDDSGGGGGCGGCGGGGGGD